jgi:hypothetical protein
VPLSPEGENRHIPFDPENTLVFNGLVNASFMRRFCDGLC